MRQKGKLQFQNLNVAWTLSICILPLSLLLAPPSTAQSFPSPGAGPWSQAQYRKGLALPLPIQPAGLLAMPCHALKVTAARKLEDPTSERWTGHPRLTFHPCLTDYLLPARAEALGVHLLVHHEPHARAQAGTDTQSSDLVPELGYCFLSTRPEVPIWIKALTLRGGKEGDKKTLRPEVAGMTTQE